MTHPTWHRFLVPMVLAVTLASGARAELRLVPEPASVKPETGVFRLSGEVTIAVAAGNADDRFAAELLAEEIRAATGAAPRVVSGNAGAIALVRDGSLKDAGDEGYRIEAAPGGIKVRATSAAGIFYGVQTLRQMVEPAGIPAATIDDRPALRWRGVHDDISRGPVPTLASLKRRIALLSEFKINLYALYSEQAIAYASHPLMATPGGALTPAELRELGEHARRHHVSLMIEQQVFGHLDRLLGLETYKGLGELPGGGELAPLLPQGLAFAESLLAEAAPLSTAPFVHVGGDEMDEVGRGQSSALVAERGLGTLYVERIARLAAALERRGKRLMFWGDFVGTHPELAARLPKDAVAAVWDYEGREGFEARLAPLRKAGLDVFVCPGTSNWNRVFPNLATALPNIRGFIREGQRAGAIGALVCTWDDNGDALFGLSWYPVVYAAGAAWKRGDYDPERFRAAFDWVFLRSAGHEAAEAVERVAGAHATLKGVRPMDATLELAWVNPARGSIDRQLLAMIEPAVARLRLSQEEAIERVARAQVKARRNGDQLDYVSYAARRIHAIGHRAIVAERFKALYGEAYQAQSSKEHRPRVVDRLSTMLGLIAQGREQTAVLRSEYERLWLSENRPYWLANVLAQFDRDTQVWTEKWDRLRVATVAFRNGGTLPEAEAMGFAP